MIKEEKLNYLYESLEPYISTHSISIHYNKHYLNYLNKLNELLDKNNFKYDIPLENIPQNINIFPKEDRENILFNLGGVLNHNLFFKCLGTKVLPSGKLKTMIDKKYNNFDNFYNLFIENALKLKGSGYTFLVLNNNNIDIINVTNQTTPYLFNYIPLFTIDLWEHSYYLDYENDRKRYLESLKPILDFSYANEVFNNLKQDI